MTGVKTQDFESETRISSNHFMPLESTPFLDKLWFVTLFRITAVHVLVCYEFRTLSSPCHPRSFIGALLFQIV